MPPINAKKYEDSAKRQKELHDLPPVPPDGTYIVVNTKAERARIGAKRTPKIDFTIHILKVVESKVMQNGKPTTKDNPQAADFLGREARTTYWANFEKPRSVQEMAWLGLACNCEEFDPDEDKGLLMLTGIPYQITIGNETRSYVDRKTKETKQMTDIVVIAVNDIGKVERKKYMDNPDWTKIVGDPSKRITTRAEEASSGGGAPDDDVPFSGGGADGGNPFG